MVWMVILDGKLTAKHSIQLKNKMGGIEKNTQKMVPKYASLFPLYYLLMTSKDWYWFQFMPVEAQIGTVAEQL